MSETTISWGAGQTRFRQPGRACKDGRSRAARRRRQVLCGLLAELGIEALGELPQSEQAVVTSLLAATLENDALLDEKLNGAPIPAADVVRCANSVQRAVSAFDALKTRRANRRPLPVADWLRDLTTPRSPGTAVSEADGTRHAGE